MKINQYCSVCKQHLDMEVIPTDDAGDDGVIWLRCPECKGFLPKFSGESLKPRSPGATTRDTDAGEHGRARSPAVRRQRRSGAPDPDAAVTDSDADLDDADLDADDLVDADLDEPDLDDAGLDEPAAPAKSQDTAPEGEPLAEFAAQLEAADLTAARPYRSTDTFHVGDVIHHLAYGDVGVVVAKEQLPGGRQAVKVYFEKVGVVRLIEQATDGP